MSTNCANKSNRPHCCLSSLFTITVKHSCFCSTSTETALLPVSYKPLDYE